MKRSGFKKKESSNFNLKTSKNSINSLKSQLRRTPIRKVSLKPKKRIAGQETVKELKAEIQALLRQICIKRDKKCILFGIRCAHEYGMEGVVFQAEHLIERSNSATYADHRLVVLVCKNCHGWKHFRKSNEQQYDLWVKSRLSPERVKLWERCEAQSWQAKRTGAYDWKLEILALKKELSSL